MELFSGKVWYWKGEWKKDDNGKSYIERHMNSTDYEGSISFSNTIAMSVEQLGFILSKKVAEKQQLDYPIAIDLESAQLTREPVGETNEQLENFIHDINVEE